MINCGQGQLERSEKLNIKINLDKKKAEKYKNQIKVILGTEYKLDEDEILAINLDLLVDYYNIVKKLEAAKTIISDPDLIINFDLKELKHGRCLLEEVFKELHRLEIVYEKKL